jgi:hypothetical protein
MMNEGPLFTRGPGLAKKKIKDRSYSLFDQMIFLSLREEGERERQRESLLQMRIPSSTSHWGINKCRVQQKLWWSHKFKNIFTLA